MNNDADYVDAHQGIIKRLRNATEADDGVGLSGSAAEVEAAAIDEAATSLLWRLIDEDEALELLMECGGGREDKTRSSRP